MIFIVHGDNEANSRKVVTQLRDKLNVTNKKDLNIVDTPPQALKEELGSFDLFAEPPFIVLDVSDASRKNVKDHLNVLENIHPDVHLVIYSSKELSKANAFIKSAKKLGAKIVCSNLTPESNIFKFLDMTYYKNRNSAYAEMRKLLNDNEDPYYLFTMLNYSLRNISYAKFDAPEYNRLAPFVKSKVKKQANNFAPEDLKDLYKHFYESDKMFKLGQITAEIMLPLTIEQIVSK